MKTYTIFRGAVAVLLLAVVIIVGCSKTEFSAGAGADHKLGDAISTSSANEPGGGNPQFLDCPSIQLASGVCPSSFRFTGTLVGMGNAKGAYLTIVAKLHVSPLCYNPGNKKEYVAGVSKVFERRISNKYYPFDYRLDKNGRINFTELTPPVTEADFGRVCPNDKWSFCLQDAGLEEWHIYLDDVEITNTVGKLTCN